MGSPKTARQLAANDTRHRLFSAAVRLFRAAGYHATTVDAITRQAGVAKGTFFVHFATKDAVIVELVRIQTTAAREARTAALVEGPIAALRATVMTLGTQAGSSRELSRAALAATLDNSEVANDTDALFGDILTTMIGDARAAAPQLRAGVDPERLARGLIAAYIGAAFNFASKRASAELTELLAPLVDALIEANLKVPHAKQPHRRPARR